MANESKLSNPLAEVFGFPTTNCGVNAARYRNQQLCPFNNKVPNCTKDKAKNPLGVCSIHHGNQAVITCPVRFRENWLIIEHAAAFAFGAHARWTSLSEIKLQDQSGQSAGNIDFVLVSYDPQGYILDFASLEVQGVYITGNLRNPFEQYIQAPDPSFQWPAGYNFPKPDYLSSSRKRLIPQMLYKGGIFKAWGKKQSVALQHAFFATLPELPTVPSEDADIAWLLYDLVYNPDIEQYRLTHIETVYTAFEPALARVTNPMPGEMQLFMETLQHKLDEHLESNPPDAPSLNDFLNS
ncbi:MAG: NotI family restriction endonuclease [Bacteroidia bacterium]|nr:NotI family restriction endonuclease [Bacteroidia bacterium]